MKNCLFISLADRWWLCPQCDWLYYGKRAPQRNCPKARDRMIAEIDKKLDELTQIEDEIDKLVNRLLCWELQHRPGRKGCGKAEKIDDRNVRLQR